ncbi:hypothetical protein J3R83DRAFT_13179 [Lanmaoa asiatica]|nr:hypothetical protein J3R83DRAFT_13179 [Lanmaoa asiatica]
MFHDDDDDANDLYGPFSSHHIPAGLAHNPTTSADLDELFSGGTADDGDPDASPPIQRVHTRHLREHLGPDKAAKVAAVLVYMNQLGLNLPLFLDLLSWGDPDCVTDPKIRYERSALMVSEELPSIIARWHHPPRQTNSTHVRAHGASAAIECFAFNCVRDVIDDELEGIGHVLRCPAEDLSMEEKGNSFLNLSRR